MRDSLLRLADESAYDDSHRAQGCGAGLGRQLPASRSCTFTARHVTEANAALCRDWCARKFPKRFIKRGIQVLFGSHVICHRGVTSSVVIACSLHFGFQDIHSHVNQDFIACHIHTLVYRFKTSCSIVSKPYPSCQQSTMMRQNALSCATQKHLAYPTPSPPPTQTTLISSRHHYRELGDELRGRADARR
jgi:hypothetical protein